MDLIRNNADENPSGDDLALVLEGRPSAVGSSHGSASAEEASHGQLLSGQSYNRIAAGGSSRLHAGNVYNNYYQVESSAPRFTTTRGESDTLETFLRCLSFEQMETRLASIATAHPDTCTWLVDCPQYKRWRDPKMLAEHHGCFWIKGKPGAGKSTIMKILLRRVQAAEVGDKVVSFFFNARGATLERTTEGLYRSVLYQVAGDVPSPLTDLRAETIELYGKQGWPLELLKDLCRKALRRLSSETKTTIFIDALDEGDVEDDVRDMVGFIEELAAEASSGGRTLHICLASRHYPTISILHSELLILDTLEDHDEDITNYVRAQLRIDSPALRANLVASIVHRARAVFLWVILVVKILNKEIDRGNQHLLEAKLRELPSGLHDLFEAILGRDAEYDPRLLPALLWVLFARRSLMPAELYFAIMISTNQLGADNVVWDPNVVNQTVLTKFLLSSSMGLLEIVESAYENNFTKKVQITNSVQVIHESVREYLLTHGLQKLDEDLSLNVRAKCHGRLAEWCSSYIEMAVASGLLGRSEQSRAMRQCPLLDYVVLYALNHAERAAEEGYQDPTHTATSFETWRLVTDIRFSRSELYVPSYAVHPNSLAALQNSEEDGIGRQPVCTTMLHLLTLQRLPYLVNIELEQVAKRDAKERQLYLDAVCLRADGYNSEYSKSGCSALEIATSMGDVGMTRALLRAGADANLCCGRHGSPLEVALRLVVNTGDREAPNDIRNIIRRFSPDIDRFKILHMLLENGAVSPVDTHYKIAPPLLRAIETEDWAAISRLLKTYTEELLTPSRRLLHIDYIDSYGLHDSDQSSDEDTTGWSDGSVEKTAEWPSLYETNKDLRELETEIVDPPRNQIVGSNVLGRIYDVLFGPSTRHNLPF
jgi:hypothetical protein